MARVTMAAVPFMLAAAIVAGAHGQPTTADNRPIDDDSTGHNAHHRPLNGSADALNNVSIRRRTFFTDFVIVPERHSYYEARSRTNESKFVFGTCDVLT